MRPPARHPDQREVDREEGSITPLILGFVLILLLLGFAVGAVGSVVLAREQLQSVCDGAAVTAGNALRPGASDTANTGLARTAADTYVRDRSATMPFPTVTVADGTAALTCTENFTPTFLGLIQVPLPQTLTVSAHGRPDLLD